MECGGIIAEEKALLVSKCMSFAGRKENGFFKEEHEFETSSRAMVSLHS